MWTDNTEEASKTTFLRFLGTSVIIGITQFIEMLAYLPSQLS